MIIVSCMASPLFVMRMWIVILKMVTVAVDMDVMNWWMFVFFHLRLFTFFSCLLKLFFVLLCKEGFMFDVYLNEI